MNDDQVLGFAALTPTYGTASYKGGYKIEIVFDDGKVGVVDFTKYLEKGGVFERFKDIGFFRDFRVNKELGVLTWRDAVDVAPETLYAEATGSPLPEWVIAEEEPKRTSR